MDTDRSSGPGLRMMRGSTGLRVTRRHAMLSLVDSGQVLIRRVRPDDGDLLGAFFHNLSPQSRRRRFHSGLREVPQSWLDQFTHPDEDGELALLAIAGHARTEACVGEARYALVDDALLQREFALVIADAWQGLGIGSRLLCELTRHAEDRGVETLYGDVLRDNPPMLGLAQRLGYRLLRHPTDATLLRVAQTLNGPRQQIPVPFSCCEPAPA